MTATVDNPARRGDLVVIERTERCAGLTYLRFEVMEVAGIHRNGRIKTVRSLDFPAPKPLTRIVGFERSLVIPAQRIDKDAAVDAVRAHRWPGHEDSPMIRPFESLAEVRALLRPFVHTEPSPIGATQ